LEKYQTLDNLLDHAEEVAGAKRRRNLMEGREAALLSRRLVKLDDDMPIEIDWNAGAVDSPDAAALQALLDEFGFRSLRDKIDSLLSEKRVEWKADYRTVDTPAALAELIGKMLAAPAVSIDTETTHISPRQAEIVGYSFCFSPGEAYYVPVLGPPGETTLDPQATLEALRPLLENPHARKVGQNLKYDMIVLRGAGARLQGLHFDTMIASYLLEAGRRNHNLDDLAKRHLNHVTIKIDSLIGSGRNQKRMDEAPIAAVTDYAAEDADVPLRLQPILERQLADADLTELFHDLEMPLIDVLAEMEFNGIRVDAPRLSELSKEYGERVEALEAEIHALAGRPLNVASPKQLQAVLFDELGLPVVKRTKTGPSTDAEVLEVLALKHELPAKIIEYRQYAKLKNTYVDALPTMVHPETGRVHASFNQVVAATGRLSSSDPNLQNIPVRTQAGREIRSAFVPGNPGWKLLAADYSQIELRVLAHFSGDETLCQAFENDEDIHARVAAEVYGVALTEVTSEQRRAAKGVNFGVIYGQSPFGLARALGIEQADAAAFIDAYFARYPGVDKFLVKTLADCGQSGYVSTILGRRRTVEGIRPVDLTHPGSGRQRNLAERTAINTVIQGSAADLIKKAMIRIHRRLQQPSVEAKMLLQIHDELIFEVPSEQIDWLAELVTQEMTEVMSLAVPLKVDVKTGDNWAQCEPWDRTT
jgi:DNA polymerase-1